MDAEDKYLALIADARDALVEKDGIIKRLADALETKSEMAEIGEAITTAGKWFTIAEAAKELIVQVGKRKRIGQNQFYAFLRNTGLLMRKVDRAGEPPFWNYHQPYQTEIDTGRMKLEERQSNQHPDKISRLALISPTGLAFYQKKINQAIEEGVLDELLG